MKKAILAGALMLGMLGLSVWNICHLDAFTDELEVTLELSRALWAEGDAEQAAVLAEQALSDWFAAEGYTHIFIRHAEVDSATNAFYELLTILSSEDVAAAGHAYDQLESHLRLIDAMEHVTVKSVF